MSTRQRLLIAVFCTLWGGSHVHADDLTVLREIGGRPPKGMMSRYLKRHAEEAFEGHQAAYETMKTPDQVAAYRERRGSGKRSAGGGRRVEKASRRGHGLLRKGRNMRPRISTHPSPQARPKHGSVIRTPAASKGFA